MTWDNWSLYSGYKLSFSWYNLILVSTSVATEAQNERLIKEIAIIREERDSLLNSGFGRTLTESDNELKTENEKLREQLAKVYLSKNMQHDSVRQLNQQLADLENENSKLRREKRQVILES